MFTILIRHQDGSEATIGPFQERCDAERIALSVAHTLVEHRAEALVIKESGTIGSERIGAALEREAVIDFMDSTSKAQENVDVVRALRSASRDIACHTHLKGPAPEPRVVEVEKPGGNPSPQRISARLLAHELRARASAEAKRIEPDTTKAFHFWQAASYLEEKEP